MTEVALPTKGIIDADYILDVADNGMHTFGIHANDMVFIRAQSFAASGDFVIIMQGEDTFLQKYNRCGDLDVFTAGHPAIPSIIADDSRNIQIVGKAVGILRCLEAGDQHHFGEDSFL